MLSAVSLSFQEMK